MDASHALKTSPAVVSNAAAQRPFVEVSGLSKSYGSFRALEDISFTIPAGGGLALLGPSGCGKTTVLRCIAGLETPSSGTIVIDGVTVFDAKRGIDLAPERRELGIVFQSYAIWPHMTVGQNVGLPLKVRKTSTAEMARRVSEALTLVGLRGWESRSAMELSGGQQQRVALARAIVHHPRLVLFDEPMSNLDTQLREDMRVDLRLMQERIGFTSAYVTHDHGEAFALASDILVLNRGKLEMRGTPYDVYYAPTTPFVAKFFGYNILHGDLAADGRAVDLPGGTRIAVAAADNALSGAPVSLCFRKEDVTVREQGVPDAGDLKAEILTQVFQGDADELLLAVGDLRIRAIQPPHRYVTKYVRLRIAPERCRVLPP